MTTRTTLLSGIPCAARRAAAALAATSLVCAPTALASAAAPPPALAAPASGAPSSDASDDASDDADFLALSIDTVTPQTVDAATPTNSGTVTVAGAVRNVGDRTVTDIDVRLQRAPRITRPDGVRTVLGLDQSSYGTVGLFHRVADSLDSGEKAAFTVSLPVDDPTTRSLTITEPGVYPLLVNVNGTPDYGGRARLDDARFLLPVRSLPSHGDADDRAEAHADVRAHHGAKQPGADDSERTPPPPVPVTMLYPLTAEPALTAGGAAAPGDDDDEHRLVSDDLAQSLEPGGRLDGLLSAVTGALGPDADPNGRLAEGLCLAVDPDLLVTVTTMAHDYRIAENPSDPDSGSDAPDDEDSGRAAAADWLGRLRALSSHTCTVSLPFAQADLDAVRALASPALTAHALQSPAEIVDRILGVKSVRNLVWPSTGRMGPETAAWVSTAPTAGPDAPPPPATTLLLSRNAVAVDGHARTDPAHPTHPVDTSADDHSAIAAASISTAPNVPGPHIPDASALSSVLFDMPAAAALAAAGGSPGTPSFVPDSLRYDVDHDSRAARLQDALGAVSWPVLHARKMARNRADTVAHDDADDSSAAHPSPLVLAPPQDWSVDEDEAAALLDLVDGFYDDGLAAPRPLTAAVAAAGSDDAPTARLTDPRPDDVSDGPVSDDLVRRLSDELPRIATLHGMLAHSGPGGRTPDEYITPLYQDMLRALTTAERDGTTQRATAAASAADDRATALGSWLTDRFDSVTVLSPGSVYTLASSQSPVVVVAKNDLAMPVRVGLRIHAPDGVRIGDAEDYVIPARGSRQIQVPAEIEFSRQIDLRVGLLAPDGAAVGDEVHISLHSNAYSMVIPVLTGISGALLLFLAGRRTWHRLRGQHDRADDRASSRGLLLDEYSTDDWRDPPGTAPEDEG